MALKANDMFDWQFRLDRRSLGVIHLKAIARIYGEHGNEVLELLRKNPAGAIPILLKRLKQKDEEWKQARTELNKVSMVHVLVCVSVASPCGGRGHVANKCLPRRHPLCPW